MVSRSSEFFASSSLGIRLIACIYYTSIICASSKSSIGRIFSIALTSLILVSTLGRGAGAYYGGLTFVVVFFLRCYRIYDFGDISLVFGELFLDVLCRGDVLISESLGAPEFCDYPPSNAVLQF